MPLTPEDKAILDEAFSLHESSPGVIPANMLGEVARIVGANPSQEEIGNFITGKTQVSKGDVESFLNTQKLHENPEAILKEAFAIFDIKGTGTADASEIRTVMANLGERFEGHELEEMMRVPEIDVEGQVNYQDLIRFCKQSV